MADFYFCGYSIYVRRECESVDIVAFANIDESAGGLCREHSVEVARRLFYIDNDGCLVSTVDSGFDYCSSLLEKCSSRIYREMYEAWEAAEENYVPEIQEFDDDDKPIYFDKSYVQSFGSSTPRIPKKLLKKLVRP
ncbi:hypothetical protein JQX08_01380 [Pseudomonas sp. UL073]|uniref:Uncharacterized protein n=1 Tax=Zestomonas insulae TaxID=2809017 RepID=A0ABS2IB06_9GAMM|nr:hypothetical protein [Pseudomonas insulae]MBM7059348.1 hypothetical protein [Pseudomonas insulae]